MLREDSRLIPMPKLADLTGRVFGRLTVVGREGTAGSKPTWSCRCSCGNSVIRKAIHLSNGHTSSCGCLRKEVTKRRATTHGLSRTATYLVWKGIKRRCYNQHDRCFKHYGGRGIVMCPSWLNSFENFLSDMGERPRGLTIDRIDNDGPYSPDNCRWIERWKQNRNQRSNRKIKVGEVTKLLCEWAEDLGCHLNTILSRLRMGWSERDAVTTPVRRTHA